MGKMGYTTATAYFLRLFTYIITNEGEGQSLHTLSLQG